MSSNILVLCEHDNGVFLKTTYELLSKAKELSQQLGGSVYAVVIGSTDVGSLGDYGADTVYTTTGDGFNALNTGVVTTTLQAAVEACSPSVILGSSSSASSDALPRLAIRVQAGFAPDLTELSLQDGVLVGTRACFKDKVYHDVRVSTDRKVFTVRPNAFSIEVCGGSAKEEALAVQLSDFDLSFTVEDVQTSEASYVDLTEAERIVSGGRSVKNKENFDEIIRPLAKAFGATAGASRAAVDAGYAEHSEQVGQTGKIVNPSLYIACGISGAIQHLAGMRTSRVIVAINHDKDAPIFSHATYGIVADIFDVCPELTRVLGSSDNVVATPKAEAAVETAKRDLPEPVSNSAVSDHEPVQETTPKPKEKPESAPVAAPEQAVENVPVAAPVASGVVASFDPALLDGLKAEIDSLKQELSSVQKTLQKSIGDSEKSVKSDLQRTEKNARAFQEGGFKRFDSVEKVVSAEVRKVREVLRQGITNDTQELKEGINAIRSTAIAAVVVNVLVLFLLGLMMMTH